MSRSLVFWSDINRLIVLLLCDFNMIQIRNQSKGNVSTNFRLIIEKCWSQNPNDRPTCSDLLNMFKEQHDQKQKQSNSFFFMK